MTQHLFQRDYKPDSGLTALDLVVTLAIISILIAAAVPALRQLFMQQRMKAAVAALHSGLVLARNSAIHRNGYIVLCPSNQEDSGCADDVEWQGGWIVFADLDGDRERSGEQEPLLRRGDAFPQMSILSSAYRTRLRFYPNGSAPGSNARLTFCDARGPETARQLVLSASGRVRIDGSTGGLAIACPADPPG